MRPLKWHRPRIAADARAGGAFSRLCEAALLQVRTNIPGAMSGRDAGHLHQLRVGVRRLSSTVRVFRNLLHRAHAKAFTRRLKKLLRASGRARDWDVFCATLREHGAGHELRRQAAGERLRSQRKAREALAALQSHLQLQTLQVRRDRPLAPFARCALDKLHSRVLRGAAGIDWRKRKRRHEVRIAVKRLRYACDSFCACFPGPAAQAYMEDLEALQRLLGALNDLAVGRCLLKKLGGGERVKAAMARREAALIVALQPVWAAFRARPVFWRAPA